MQPRKNDVIIIGGGVIGVSVAYYAADLGASVLVIEKNHIGAGSSCGNAGLLVPSHCNPLPTPGVVARGIRYLFNPEGPFYIHFRADLELVRWLWRFYRFCNAKHFYHCVGIFSKMGRESLQLHRQLADLGGHRYQFRQDGMLNLYITDQAFQEAREDVVRVKSCGEHSVILDADEARELEPAAGVRVVGGILNKIDGCIDPLEFVKWLAEKAREKGVRFLVDTEVFWLKTDRRRVSKVVTTRGDFEAGQVVLATGAWLPLLAAELEAKIPIEAAKGYSMTFAKTPGAPQIPLILEEARVAVTPFADALRLAGTLELSGLDLAIGRRRLKAIESETYRYLPKLGGLEIREIWRGLRPCTPDGLPVIGRLRPWSNVFVAGGHATKGMSLGPVTGKYLSQMLVGESIGMLERSLSPNRF